MVDKEDPKKDDDKEVDNLNKKEVDADGDEIEHDPMSGKKPPLWSVELKSMISEMNTTLTSVKSGMDGLLTFANESKAALSRFTTPEDGSDPEWEVRTVKQKELADAQAKVLEGLVEKTLTVLDAVSTDSQKEVKPLQNEWARKLAKKLVSGGNN